MTDVSDSKTPARRPRWLKLVFALSLGANLAVVGLVAGAALRDGPPDGKRRHRAPPPPAAAEAIGGVMYHSLSQEQRQALRQLANGDYDSVVARRVAELNALLEVIRQEPLDVVELRHRISVQTEAARTVGAALQEAWVGRLQQMSAAERDAFAAKVERHIARFRKPTPRDENRERERGGADRN